MTGQEVAGSSHHVIDIQAAGPSNCAVCRLPLECVAVAPCGHREVCAACAFFEDDRRCRVCRAHCPTVLVTKADSGLPQPPAFGAEGHAGLGGYFDDLRLQYQATRKVCAVRSPCSVDAIGLPLPGSLNVSNPGRTARTQQPADDDPEPCSLVGTFLLYLTFVGVFSMLFGILFVTAEHRYVLT